MFVKESVLYVTDWESSESEGNHLLDTATRFALAALLKHTGLAYGVLAQKRSVVCLNNFLNEL